MQKQTQKLAFIFTVAFIAFGGFLAFPKNVAKASVDPYINFQGKMTLTDGTNVTNASHPFLFCLYATATPASPCTAGANNDAIWRESKSITTVDGIFQTNLGSTTSLPSATTFNTTGLYLGINFESNGQMMPLVEFTTTPYAFNAEKLQGGDWATPGTIGATTQNTGNFTTLNADSISTDTGGVSIAAGQAYTGAGAVTLSSTTNGLTLDSGNNALTIAASDTALTASGLATLTVGANASITNASGNLTLQPGGSGTTAKVQIGLGGNGSATPDFFGLDVKSDTGDPVSGEFEGAMYYNTADNKFRCYQGSTWTDCIGSGVGSGYATIKDETNALTQRTALAFLGAGVSCADNAGQTECTIAGGAGGGLSLAPSSADTDNSIDPSIFVNDTAGGNLLQLQQAGVNKFVVANNGGLTVNGADSSIVRQTAADFALGTIGSSLDNSNGALSLADTVLGGIPNSGKGIIATGGATTSAAIGAGAFSITRADGKYLVIRGAGTGMDVYDSVAGTFIDSAQVLTAAAGVGAIALPRPGGLYRVLHGGGALTSSLVDPMGSVPVGPSITVTSKGAGTVAFLRADGKYLVTNAPALATTQIYDPIPDTFVTGPTGSGGNWGVGAVMLNKNDGQALILVGGASSATQLYDPSAGAITGGSPVGAFTVGPTLDGNKAVGTCALNGSGSVAFRRNDGKFVVLSKANVWTVYDSSANNFTCNSSGGPATAIGDGGHAIPLQDGRFLVIAGGGSQNSYIYNPSDDSFTLHGTNLTVVTTGAHSIMEVDGTWRIVVGGGQATNSYDTGLPMSDANTLYTSEDIFSASLNSNSSFWWRAQMESVYAAARNGATNTAFTTLQFLVRTAVSSNGSQSGCVGPLNSATAVEIKNSGDLIQNAVGANCVRVYVQYNRPIPKRLFDERGTWVGNGMMVSRADEIVPRLYNFKIDNSAVLKRSNFDFSSANTSAPTNPTIPSALTATQSATGGSCTAGTHAYYSTFVTDGVESQLSTKSNVITCAGGTDKVNLTNVPLGPAGTTVRKIYRTAAGDTGTPMLVPTGGTFNNNSTTSLTSDTNADAALGAAYTLVENSGPMMTKSETRVETVNGNLVLPYGRINPSTQIGTSGFYMGSYSNAHPMLTNAAGQGTMVLARDDKQFLVIEPGGNFADLYDPATQTFTNQTGAGNVPTTTNAAGVGAGAFALRRADGSFLVYLGTASTTTTCTTAGTATNIYEPSQASGSRFTNGPCLTAGGGIGAQAILNNDGTYTIVHGNATTATSIYNQMTNTMIIGPITTTAVNCGSWAIPMGLPNNNQYKVKAGVAAAGTAVATGTMNYDANSKVFSAAPNLSSIAGCGSLAFQRPDGYWVITEGETAGAVGTATNIMHPTTGVTAVGPVMAVGTGRGDSVIPRADGTFLILAGNPVVAGTTALSNIYTPTGGAIAALLTVPMGTFAAAPAGPQMGPTPAPAAPTVAIAANAAGVDAGNHYYRVTQIMNGVESIQGAASAVATTTAGNLQVNLTAIPLGASPYAAVSARRIYRTVAGAANTGTYYFVAQLDNNTTTTYNDTTTDATITTRVTIPLAAAPAAALTASAATGVGTCDNGTHAFKFSYVTNGVESLPSAVSGAIACNGSNYVPLSNISVGPAGTTARKIYRTIASSTGLIGSYRLSAIINDNVTTTYNDGGTDSALGTPALAAITGQGDGAISFQRPDGKWIVINGGSTASNVTGIYDAGWYPDGQYMSEMIQVPALAANSTLEWQKTADPYARFEVRVANSKEALSTTLFKGVDSPGSSINNAGGETWVQVEINFRRDFPSFCSNLNSVYVSGAGMAFCGRNISLPTILQYQLTNGQDLLSLQTNSYNVLRVTSNGGIYSSQQGGFFAGGADLAENYTSKDALEKGELVSIDATDIHNVKRATMAYQKDLLGVVSTAPGFVAGSYTEGSYPIALAGRVPVNVSTENGIIKAGDRIAAASIPGYGMRATVAGRSVGTALEAMDVSKMSACPAGGTGGMQAKCGQVMMFVNLADYDGLSVDTLMKEAAKGNIAIDNNGTANNIDADTDLTDAPTNSPFAQFSEQKKTLLFLQDLNKNQTNYKGTEILTSNINASGQIISPLIVADTIVAKNIKAENIEGLNFMQTSLDSAQAGVANNAAQMTDLGKEIGDFKIQLQSLLSQKTDANSVNGVKDLESQNGLTIAGPAEFKGITMFRSISEFFDKVIFQGSVEFAGQVTFNQDSAGYAIIKENQDMVTVKFAKEYATAPIVNASLSLQQIKDDEVRKAAEELLLVTNANYIITNVTTAGFEIRINQRAVSAIPFAWTAIAVSDAQTSVSEKEAEKNVLSDEILATDSEYIAPAVITDSSSVNDALTDEVAPTTSNENIPPIVNSERAETPTTARNVD